MHSTINPILAVLPNFKSWNIIISGDKTWTVVYSATVP
jgi:hypothetical protein